HGFERQWWRLRPRNPGYRSVEVQIGDGLGNWGPSSATQPAPDTSEGGVMTGLMLRSAGVAYASRMTWTEGPFRETGGGTVLHAPAGPGDVGVSIDTAAVGESGGGYVGWGAARG